MRAPQQQGCNTSLRVILQTCGAVWRRDSREGSGYHRAGPWDPHCEHLGVPTRIHEHADVVAQFTSKSQAAPHRKRTLVLRILATVFYVTNLDKYASALQTDAVLRLFLSWQDETGQQWYSLLVQVAFPGPSVGENCILPQAAVLWLVNWLAEYCLNR